MRNYILEKYTNNSQESTKSLKDFHLTKYEISRCISIIEVELSNYPQLKKCCDFVNLESKEVDDDGERISLFNIYLKQSPKSYIRIISGDTFSGYPKLKDKGSDQYDKDCESLVRAVNRKFRERKINAKFCIGSDKDEDSVDFGLKKY